MWKIRLLFFCIKGRKVFPDQKTLFRIVTENNFGEKWQKKKSINQGVRKDLSKIHIFIREREATFRGEEPGNLYEGASPFQQLKMWRAMRRDGRTDIRGREKSPGKETWDSKVMISSTV